MAPAPDKASPLAQVIAQLFHFATATIANATISDLWRFSIVVRWEIGRLDGLLELTGLIPISHPTTISHLKPHCTLLPSALAEGKEHA